MQNDHSTLTSKLQDELKAAAQEIEDLKSVSGLQAIIKLEQKNLELENQL